MKKNKKIKYIDFNKKNKLIKAMLFTIISFCSVCCFALHWLCGVVLLGLGLLLSYIVTRPVKLNFNLKDKGVIFNEDYKEKP